MKKLSIILLVSMFILTSFGAVALPDSNVNVQRTSLQVSSMQIVEQGSYALVSLEEAESMRMVEGQPMLPVITKVLSFPLGTKVGSVDVSYDTDVVTLEKKIAPAPSAVILDGSMSPDEISLSEDPVVYESDALYPANPVSVRKGAGIDKDGNHVLYVTVQVTPQYNALENTLEVPSGDIDFELNYVLPETPFVTADEFDMVVITAAALEDACSAFVDHKNSIGIRTYVKTVEDIYDEYPEGRIQPESIKLFIKDAIEEQGIEYVLLAGGVKGQSPNWYVPEFRSNNAADTESGYSSDLYYADIYKIEGNETVFEDWDSSGDDIIGEWTNLFGHKDVMDFYPDVTVSRISAHYKFELTNAFNKIITYESSDLSGWFDSAIMIAGDTFPDNNDYYEGEIETGLTADMLEAIGFDVTKLWTSLETLTGIPDVVDGISEGAGFVHFAGHGNPTVWSTHPPRGGDDGHTWTDGFNIWSMYKLKNSEKLPIVLVGGCHNAQFNVSLFNILHGIKQYGPINWIFYGEWPPRDFCSWFVLQKNGGGIASLGCTGFGYGYVGAYVNEGLGGWIEPRFFDAYANQSIDILGRMHGQAITDYINIIGFVNDDQIDRKTIEQFTLIGDPSMKVGGY